MTKDVIAAIEERASIRHFKAESVPQATIGRLLECARLAPSAGNVQPWFFVVVLNDQVRQKLVQAAYEQEFLDEAPVIIVVCVEPSRSAAKYGRRGEELYCIQDAAAAIENMLLAATGYGLGSCWVGSFDEQRVGQILELAQDIRPVAIIPIGYPNEDSKPVPRRSLDEMVRIIH